MTHRGLPASVVAIAASFLLAAGLGCEGSSPPGSVTGAAGTGPAGTSGSAGTGAAGTGAAGVTGGAGNGGPAGSSGAAGATGVAGAGAAGTGAAGMSPQTDGGAAGAQPGADARPVDASTDAIKGGDAGPARAAKPSAGCGKASPMTGARTIMTGGQMATFNVKLPTGYVATTPVPLGFGFHGFSNGACGPTSGECQGFANLPAVTVYMKSISDGWEQAAVLEQNITFFQDVLALAKNEF
jgi:pilus assembly protein FimV